MYAVNDESADIAETQELLRRYGYNIEVNGRLDQWTLIVLRSFQLHFRPARADGKFDRATLDTLTRLVSALPVPALT